MLKPTEGDFWTLLHIDLQTCPKLIPEAESLFLLSKEGRFSIPSRHTDAWAILFRVLL